MSTGETENPRIVLPKAFKAVFNQLTAFFVLGALIVGVLVPYYDPNLIAVYQESSPGAAASPYILAMHRLHIPILPHLVNALVLTSVYKLETLISSVLVGHFLV